MILIAHRGNTNGPNPEKENNPGYIMEALALGYNVEVDVWFVNGEFLLGHDAPVYVVPENFFKTPRLWVHCKDVLTFYKFTVFMPYCNSFFHSTDDVVLTTQGYLWTYPGKPLYSKSICVLPEWKPSPNITGACGICSDFIKDWV